LQIQITGEMMANWPHHNASQFKPSPIQPFSSPCIISPGLFFSSGGKVGFVVGVWLMELSLTEILASHLAAETLLIF
jgi:hypothetical protein